jgi:hypothetical protein
MATTLQASHRSAVGRMRYRLAALLLLSIATVAAFHAGFRYRTVEKAIVPDISAEGWRASPRGVALPPDAGMPVSLSAHGGGSFPSLVRSIDNPQRFRSVRVTAELGSFDLRPGPGHWQRGRILLRSLDRNGRRLRHLEDEVGSVQGNTNWRRVELIVPIEPDTARLALVIYNAASGGVMLVRNLHVDSVVESALFTALRVLLIVLWAACMLWTAWPVLTRRRWQLLPAAAVLTGLAILAGTLAPQPQLSNMLRPIVERAERIARPVIAELPGLAILRSRLPSRPAQPAASARLPGDEDGGARPPQDWRPRLGAGWHFLGAHFAAYVLLGLVAAAAFPGAPRINVAAYLAAFAVASEAMQSFQASRTVALDDTLANLAGAGLGMIVVWLIRGLGRRIGGRSAL